MSGQVVASLDWPVVLCLFEGMRVVVNDGWCELHEYNFMTERWVPKARREWPMARDEAQRWVEGWNALDRFTAINRLVAPVPE